MGINKLGGRTYTLDRQLVGGDNQVMEAGLVIQISVSIGLRCFVWNYEYLLILESQSIKKIKERLMCFV